MRVYLLHWKLNLFQMQELRKKGEKCGMNIMKIRWKEEKVTKKTKSKVR